MPEPATPLRSGSLKPEVGCGRSATHAVLLATCRLWMGEFFFSMNTECVLCLWGRLWHGWLCACEEGPGHHYF